MTLNELLDGDIEKLEKMTDAELLEYCKPYFTVTRPEMAVRDKGAGAHRVDPALVAKVKQMAELGIDVSYLLKPSKKR